LITWWPCPFAIRIGARRFALKSSSVSAARTVTYTEVSSASLDADPVGLVVGELHLVGVEEPPGVS